MKSEKSKQIIYTGGLEELLNLANKDGELDNDKLYDWLSKSKQIICEPEVRLKINQIVRKNKINKINYNDK